MSAWTDVSRRTLSVTSYVKKRRCCTCTARANVPRPSLCATRNVHFSMRNWTSTSTDLWCHGSDVITYPLRPQWATTTFRHKVLSLFEATAPSLSDILPLLGAIRRNTDRYWSLRQVSRLRMRARRHIGIISFKI